MTKQTKRRLIILGILVAVVLFFLTKGWVTKEDLLSAAQQALTGESASQSETVLPEFEASLPAETSSQSAAESDAPPDALDEHGTYTSKEDVALYLHTYGHLPDNFLTKSEAQKRGWVSNEGNLDDVAPGMSIGGDRFSNREGNLPTADGRKWYECDINYAGGYRGAERILFSSDGLIFYTDDHYESFTQLY